MEQPDTMVCEVCGERFDPRLLDMVILHFHEPGPLPEPTGIVGWKVSEGEDGQPSE